MDSDNNQTPTGDRPDPTRGSRRVTLWCGACGRSHSLSREEVSECIRDGFPRCCGRAMGIYPGLPRGERNPAE